MSEPYEVAVVLMGACVGAYVFGLISDLKRKHSDVIVERRPIDNVLPIKAKKGKRAPKFHDDFDAFKAENPDMYPK